MLPARAARRRPQPLIVRGMYGLGDNIYQRALVRELGPCHIFTPWPELYEDLPEISFLNGATELRTQKKNMQAQPAGRWDYLPVAGRSLRITYGSATLGAGRTIFRAMEQAAGLALERPVFDLPDLGPGSSLRPDRPYVVVRPATVRGEWYAPARNPRAEYLPQVAAWLREDGWAVVSVADLDGTKERLWGEAPPADLTLHRGELPVRDLLALLRDAAGAVGGVGWLVPACMATRTPMLCVAGGLGAHNAPEVVCDPRLPTEQITWALPDPYCRCDKMTHDCPREIPDLRARYEAWRDAALPR